MSIKLWLRDSLLNFIAIAHAITHRFLVLVGEACPKTNI